MIQRIIGQIISLAYESYSLPLNDENVKKMKTEDWKLLVKNTLKRDAFLQLEAQCLANRKTYHLSYDRLKAQDYLFSLEPKCARIIFRTRCRMTDLKVNFKKKYGMDLRCPFCNDWDETLEHIFVGDSGLNFPKILTWHVFLVSFLTKRLEFGEILRQIFLIPRRTAKLKEGYSFIFAHVFIVKSDIVTCKSIN